MLAFANVTAEGTYSKSLLLDPELSTAAVWTEVTEKDKGTQETDGLEEQEAPESPGDQSERCLDAA